MNLEVLLKKSILPYNQKIFLENILRLKKLDTLEKHDENEKKTIEQNMMEGFIDKNLFYVYKCIFNF